MDTTCFCGGGLVIDGISPSGDARHTITAHCPKCDSTYVMSHFQLTPEELRMFTDAMPKKIEESGFATPASNDAIYYPH